MAQRIRVVPGSWSVARLPADAELPAWAACLRSASERPGAFVSITRSDDELSIVTLSTLVPPEVRAERDLSLLRLDGTVDLQAVGVLRSLLGPLADAGISVLAISTFDTDYLLVRRERLAAALEALRAAGVVQV